MCSQNHFEPDRQPAEFYRLLLEHASVALVATDATFTICLWNGMAERLLGAPAGQMLGRHLQEAVPENRRKTLLRLLERTQAGKISHFRVEQTDASGHKRHLLVVLSPGGDPGGVAAWIVDETVRRRLEDRLAQSERMASLGTLAGGVAHHFNNIMGGVATFVDFALTSGDPAAMKRALQMTNDAAARVSAITHSLLAFVRHDAPEDVADLPDAVRAFARQSLDRLTRAKSELQMDLSSGPRRPVDAAKIRRVLTHLLDNALEAMPGGGTVSISLTFTHSEAVLRFADTGGGISPENLSLIFEPFFTTKGLSGGGSGTNPGLGLYIVHGMIEQMGGRIEVGSPAGQGAAFVMHLPLSNPR